MQEHDNKPSPDQSPQFLPQISEETRTRLTEDFKVKPREHRIYPTESWEQVRTASQGIAETVMESLAGYNPQFVQMLFNTLHTTFETETKQMPMTIDGYTVGMSVVLHAFNIEDNFSLLERFSELDRNDIQGLQGRLEQQLQATTAPTILERTLKAPRIPFEQVNLNAIVNQVSEAHGQFTSSAVSRGGAVMYEGLKTLWPKLHKPVPR